MPISKDLFLAILSMDAYNRGYGAGISNAGENDPDGLGENGAIGGATIDRTSAVLLDPNGARLDIAAGFYAVAYDTPDGTVISYRGTDEVKDVWNGWTSIGGFVPAQAELAAQFYHSVRAANPDGKIMLTGHSLGGGLAA